MNITKEQLVKCIKEATQEVTVCTPSGDYYSRPDDWSEETIRFVHPQWLINAINSIEE